MEVSCDPEQAYSEGCCELSSVVSHLPLRMVSLPLLGDVCVILKPLSHLPVHGSVEDMQR